VVASPPSGADLLPVLSLTVIVPRFTSYEPVIVFPSISILISFVISVYSYSPDQERSASRSRTPTFWVAYHFLPEGLGAPHSFNSLRRAVSQEGNGFPADFKMLPKAACAGRLIGAAFQLATRVKNGELSGGSGAHLAGFGDCIRGSLLELWWSRLMVGSPVAYPASGRCGSLRHGVSEADGQPAAVPVEEF
jgi:hypothetical protein